MPLVPIRTLPYRRLHAGVALVVWPGITESSRSLTTEHDAVPEQSWLLKLRRTPAFKPATELKSIGASVAWAPCSGQCQPASEPESLSLSDPGPAGGGGPFTTSSYNQAVLRLPTWTLWFKFKYSNHLRPVINPADSSSSLRLPVLWLECSAVQPQPDSLRVRHGHSRGFRSGLTVRLVRGRAGEDWLGCQCSARHGSSQLPALGREVNGHSHKLTRSESPEAEDDSVRVRVRHGDTGSSLKFEPQSIFVMGLPSITKFKFVARVASRLRVRHWHPDSNSADVSYRMLRMLEDSATQAALRPDAIQNFQPRLKPVYSNGDWISSSWISH